MQKDANKELYYEDEIDLREIINVIFKRKKTILKLLIFGILLGIIISVRLPKVYETTSLLEIAKINNEPLLTKEEIAEIIKSRKFLSQIINDLNLNIANLEDINKAIKTEDIKNTDFLKIIVQYPRKELTQKINEKIINYFILQNKPLYEKKISLLNERLKELEEEISKIEQENKYKDKRELVLLEKDQQETFKKITIEDVNLSYIKYLRELKDRYFAIKEILLNARDFKIIDSAVVPKYPIRPNKKLIVTVFAMLSLFMGIFWVLISESWSKSS